MTVNATLTHTFILIKLSLDSGRSTNVIFCIIIKSLLCATARQRPILLSSQPCSGPLWTSILGRHQYQIFSYIPIHHILSSK